MFLLQDFHYWRPADVEKQILEIVQDPTNDWTSKIIETMIKETFFN